jgi:integrase/recombinase XerD
MDKYILKAGIGGMGYTPHKLRHTFATVLSKTASASVVQSALGHANLNTSQIYIHLGQNEVQNAVRDSAVNDFGS